MEARPSEGLFEEHHTLGGGGGPAPVCGSPSCLTCRGPVEIQSACMWQFPWWMRQLLASGGRGAGMRGGPSVHPSIHPGACPLLSAPMLPCAPPARPGLTEARPHPKPASGLVGSPSLTLAQLAIARVAVQAGACPLTRRHGRAVGVGGAAAVVMGTRVHRWGQTGPESYEQGGGAWDSRDQEERRGERGRPGGGVRPQRGQRLERALGQWSGWT